MKHKRKNTITGALLSGAAAGGAAALTAYALAPKALKKVAIANPATSHGFASAKGYPYVRGEGFGKELHKPDRTIWMTRFTKTSDGSGRALYVGYDEATGKFVSQLKENPVSAAEAYTEFHGRGPREVLTFQESSVQAGDYFALGDMGGLWLHTVNGKAWGRPDIQFEKQDGVKLAADKDGKQLFLMGGNQELPRKFIEQHTGGTKAMRFAPLGVAHGISYHTEKSFDRFRKSEYVHAFGEETGEKPEAYYDTELERIYLVGGAYRIENLDPALGASPGIAN